VYLYQKACEGHTFDRSCKLAHGVNNTRRKRFVGGFSCNGVAMEREEKKELLLWGSATMFTEPIKQK